jgi:hypothetical protein
MLFGWSCGLRGLVLVLGRIQFQIEEAGQIAAGGSAATAAPTLLTECNLDLPESGFGA